MNFVLQSVYTNYGYTESKKVRKTHIMHISLLPSFRTLIIGDLATTISHTVSATKTRLRLTGYISVRFL